MSTIAIAYKYLCHIGIVKALNYYITTEQHKIECMT
jgi:hypothetical protein